MQFLLPSSFPLILDLQKNCMNFVPSWMHFTIWALRIADILHNFFEHIGNTDDFNTPIQVRRSKEDFVFLSLFSPISMNHSISAFLFSCWWKYTDYNLLQSHQSIDPPKLFLSVSQLISLFENSPKVIIYLQ